MEGTPRGLDPGLILATMLGVDGINDAHHLHLWNLASDVPALSAHIVLEGEPTLREVQETTDQVRGVLQQRFAIANVTLESEYGDEVLAAGDLGATSADSAESTEPRRGQD